MDDTFAESRTTASHDETLPLTQVLGSIRDEHAPDVSHLKAGVARRIGVTSLEEGKAAPRRVASRAGLARWSSRSSRIAGSLGAAVLVAGVIWLAPWSERGPAAETTAAARTYRTEPGERATITLDDGTAVRLNVASRLTVPAGYGVTTRQVALEGEAQFVVTADPKNPFSVDAEGTIVRDLATTFFIRAYRGSNPRVAVTDGRVSVQAPAVTQASAVVLDAGEAAAVQDDGTLRTSGLDRAMLSWTEGRLLLRDMPLGAALAELRRWYGKDFRVADSTLLPVRINATLPIEMNMDVLRSVAEVAGATLHVDDETITFAGRR